MTEGSKKSVVGLRLLHLLIVLVLIAFDQLTKYLIRASIGNDGEFVIWKGVFKITFLKNDGAVWGFLSGKQNSVIFLTIITFIILAGILFFYFRVPLEKKYLAIRLIFVFIVAGAIGNLIDRIALNYVTDFLYFELINFPVFNVADCYITCSCFALVILLLTKYRNDELAFFGRKKPEEKSEDSKEEN